MAERQPPSVAERERPTVRPQPGWREVLVLAGSAVVVVLGAAVLTSLLPASAQDVVFRTPLAILVLIVGTGWLLWRISRRPPGAPER